VLHYTAGPDAESAVRQLLNQRSGASVHLVIGRAGDVTQLADFTQRVWHAGRRSDPGPAFPLESIRSRVFG
jgi:N-acetylmuramoyl-L-alanine amidase